MNTISTEQAKDLRMAFEAWQKDFDPAKEKAHYDFFGLGIAAMDELLALRKEREKAEPVAYMIGGHYLMHANDPKVDNYSSAVPLYTAPPAPVVPGDWLPYDQQIAEYEQMMEAEQTQADTTAQQFESLAGKATIKNPEVIALNHPDEALIRHSQLAYEVEKLVIDVKNAIAHRKSQSLKIASMVPEGWRLVPIEPTPMMLIALWASREGMAGKSENKIARVGYRLMLAAAPEPCK
ncbi:hypothetical protein R2308_002977 [Cronobacter turicensis]|nr:hypothetical protein [Cronobacter turicensis]